MSTMKSEEAIITATIDYERWVKTHVAVVDADLQRKHEEMATSLFAFLRATFYRWASLWSQTPKVLISMWRISEPGAMARVGWFGA